MTKYLGIVLDDRRLREIKGTPLEEKVQPIFGGALKILVLEVSDELAKRVIDEFAGARFDARGFIEETPIAFRRALFKRVVEMKSLGEEAVKKALEEDVPRLKEEIAKERTILPVPDIDISDILELQKNPVQKPA